MASVHLSESWKNDTVVLSRPRRVGFPPLAPFNADRDSKASFVDCADQPVEKNRIEATVL
jgi:hypothetical protein